MDEVRLPASVRTAMIAHARDEAPNECCGLLIGRDGEIVDAVPARNLLASPTRYLLDPAAHIDVRRRLRGTDRAVIGAYHSHPDAPAAPSDTDRAEALYPEFLWVIVSLAAPEGDVAAFRLTERAAAPVTIVLES